MKTLRTLKHTTEDFNTKSLNDLKVEYIDRYSTEDFLNDLKDERADANQILADILNYNNSILDCGTVEELAEVLTDSEMNHDEYYVEYSVETEWMNIWTDTTYILGSLLTCGDNKGIEIHPNGYMQSCRAYDVEEDKYYLVWFKIEYIDTQEFNDSIVRVIKIKPE